MSRLFFPPVRTPVRIVKNRNRLFALTPFLPMKFEGSSAPGNVIFLRERV